MDTIFHHHLQGVYTLPWTIVWSMVRVQFFTLHSTINRAFWSTNVTRVSCEVCDDPADRLLQQSLGHLVCHPLLNTCTNETVAMTITRLTFLLLKTKLFLAVSRILSKCTAELLETKILSSGFTTRKYLMAVIYEFILHNNQKPYQVSCFQLLKHTEVHWVAQVNPQGKNSLNQSGTKLAFLLKDWTGCCTRSEDRHFLQYSCSSHFTTTITKI